MNIAQFFDHWGIVDNPFRGEEARHDAVFARMTELHAGAAHSDFEKILGDLRHPSTAIVFGEKGSGKTAIRLQMARRINEYNRDNPSARVLLVAYDDLNTILDRFYARVAVKDPLTSFERLTLTDHIDAILSCVVPRLVGGIIGAGDAADRIDLGPDVRRTARRLDRDTKRDLMLLQTVYDDPADSERRTHLLARILRVGRPMRTRLWIAGVWLGWIPAVALLVAAFVWNLRAPWLLYPLGGLVGLWLVVVVKAYIVDRFTWRRVAKRVRRHVRISDRSDASYAASLQRLDPALRPLLPISPSDEPRYAMLDRLKRALAAFGIGGMFIVMDRVDEPTLVSGDAKRMQAIVWPLLNTKFLQQEDIGVKLLLPIDLRHALLKESSSFFQGARLDKQNLVERLSWTGAMLYDLAEARLRACRPGAAKPIALLDLFAEDVTRKDVIDALDQMHQPRDAFKFLYRCLTEHCSNVTAEEGEWKVPRLVLEIVRKQESDRLQQLYRGIRPA